MKKIFLVYGHYNDKSFNAAIRDTFVKTAEAKGNKVDLVDLYKENFNPVFAGEEPDEDVLNHRQRIEECDTVVLIAPIWNFRMPAIVEGWIDKVLAPPWAFKFKQLWGNYGYPIGNLRQKKAIIFCTYGSPRLAITTFFAVFASFTNLALSASALGTKYLNEIFTVTREVKDKVSGEIQTTADYSELGILLIVVTLLTLILPILFVFIINNSKYKTQE